jgi:hypothetical protein
MNQNTLPIKDARDALLERLDRIDNYSDLEIGFLIEYYPILVDRILHELRVIKLIGTESEHKKEYINDPSRIRNLLQDIDEVSIGIDNLQAGYISLGNAKIYDIFADPSNDYGNK